MKKAMMPIMFRWVSALAVIAMQASCSTMRPVESPGAYLAGRSPGVVVVIDASGKTTEIATPKLVSDTVFGYNAEGDEVVIPVTQVNQLIARQLSVGRTVLLGAVVVGATYFLATAVLGFGDDPMIPPPEGEPEDYLMSNKPFRSYLPLLRLRIGW